VLLELVLPLDDAFEDEAFEVDVVLPLPELLAFDPVVVLELDDETDVSSSSPLQPINVLAAMTAVPAIHVTPAKRARSKCRMRQAPLSSWAPPSTPKNRYHARADCRISFAVAGAENERCITPFRLQSPPLCREVRTTSPALRAWPKQDSARHSTARETDRPNVSSP